jgi:hypothetical protein
MKPRTDASNRPFGSTYHPVASVTLDLVAIALGLAAAGSCGGLGAKSGGGRDAGAGDPPGSGVRDVGYESPCPPYSPPQPIPGTCCGNPGTLNPVSPDTPCIFAVPLLVPDPNNAAVYLDKNLVTQDATNGWLFGDTTSTVVLYGTTCDKVVAEGASASVQFVCVCGSAAPPACIP